MNHRLYAVGRERFFQRVQHHLPVFRGLHVNHINDDDAAQIPQAHLPCNLAARFQIQPQPSDAMLTIRSALRYKYKPTIRYGVELYRGSGNVVGALKVSFRTQSQPLLEMLTAFFELWAKLEGHYRSQLKLPPCQYAIEGGKFIRKFAPEGGKELSDRQLADGMSEYIRMFDSAIKSFFAAGGEEAQALPEMETIYRKYLNGASILM